MVVPGIRTATLWLPNGSDTWQRVGYRAAVSAVPRGVDFAGMPEMSAVEIGPERVEKDKLGVGRLPEQEIGKALLARGAHPQVHFRNVGLVEIPGKKALVDLIGANFPGRDLARDRGGGVGDFRPAAVVAAELQGEDGVLLAQLLGVLELPDDAAPQPRPAARPADADAPLG